MADAKLSGVEDLAWRGFLRTYEALWRELERRLGDLGVSMAEYSVLALLGEAGPGGMNMSELAEKRLMSSSGFSRLADRLEQRSLIERRRSVTDGRSFDAVLTKTGRVLLRKVWRQHHQDLRELFFNHLTPSDLEHLAKVWARLRVPSRPGQPSASSVQ